jgi:hypothetical protein
MGNIRDGFGGVVDLFLVRNQIGDRDVPEFFFFHYRASM